jgi:TRAP-type mannitol/chloroaromatic compound transport system permease small subunit
VAPLLRISALIDALNERVGKTVYWLVLATVLISAGNAIMRKMFSMSSNAWLELQWYLFSAVFLLCSGYTLLRNEHVRIDVVDRAFEPQGAGLDRRPGHALLPASDGTV